MPMTPLLLRHGRIIDPANRRDQIGDLLLGDGRIAENAQLATLNS